MSQQKYSLTVFLKFPREALCIEPPIPTGPAEGASLDTQLGRISFFFDDWDAPPDNQPGDPPALIDFFGVSVTCAELPEELSSRLRSAEYESCLGIVEVRPPEIEALAQELTVYRRDDDGEERRKKEARLRRLHREHYAVVEARCEALLGDAAIGPFLSQLGSTLRRAVSRFVRLLKVEYGQVLLPDQLPILTARMYWTLPDGAVRHAESVLLDRILRLRSWADAGDHVRPVRPGDWPQISLALAEDREPAFSEVLIASALGQCDPDLGNPRLAVVEAVCAVEIEIRQLLALKLASLGLAPSTADRVLKETPLADLATVWLRKPLTEAGIEIDNQTFQRSAEAIHERHEIMHRGRRQITLERARQHVDALAALARAARLARGADPQRNP